MTVIQLPLFPLSTVMFPGATLTLHIFEERYRLMIGQCLEESSPFGVVLIRDGSEVGEAANPYEIGTLVQINASVRLEDGRLLIATVGQQRFRLNQITQHVPYLMGDVTLLPDEHDQPAGPAADELRLIHDQYWQAVTAATGVPHEVESLPGDAISLSHHLAHRLQVPNERKQRWLEVDVRTRVREISSMLRSEISLLPRPDQPINPAGLSGASSPDNLNDDDDETPGLSNLPWSWN